MRFRIKRQVVIFVAAAAVAIGFIIFRYMPLGRLSRAMAKEQAALNSVIERGLIKEAELESLRKQLSELNVRLSDFDLRIPRDTQLGQFLGKVAALMDEYNLSDQQIAPQEEIASGSLVCIPVTMKCSGRLDQIRSFCRSLGGLDRQVRIQKFRLVNDSEYGGQLRMETEAVIYHCKRTGRS